MLHLFAAYSALGLIGQQGKAKGCGSIREIRALGGCALRGEAGPNNVRARVGLLAG